MASLGTVTIDLEPSIDPDVVKALVNQAVADALRALADSLTEKPTPNPDERPRYYAVVREGVAGIADREAPSEWAAYEDEDDFDLAIAGATDLNNGVNRDLYRWTPRPTA